MEMDDINIMIMEGIQFIQFLNLEKINYLIIIKIKMVETIKI